MRKPNFYIVGAPRCGTRAMFTYLSDHPDITMPVYEKEPHYFASDLQAPRFERFRGNEKKYLSLFSHGQDKKRIGESSVHYLYSKVAAQEIYDYTPDAKIIVMVRNPVDWAFSWYYRLRSRLRETYDTFEDALDAEPRRRQGEDIPKGFYLMPEALFYREQMRFSEQLERYIERFDTDQIHIVVLDDMKKDTAQVYRSILEFLDVDPDYITDLSPMNSREVPRREFLTKLAQNYRLVKLADRVRPISLPVYNLIKQWNFKPAPRQTMNPDTRRMLLDEFAPEIDRLGNLLNRDLSYWYKD